LFCGPPEGRPAHLTDERLAEHRRVLVVGPAATGSQVAAACPDAARLYLDGHYPLVTCAGGAQVSYAAQWFGDGSYTALTAHEAWCRLERALQLAWRDDGVSLLMTPATTGRDLWARTIPEAGYPVMSATAQRMVRAGAGQGRMETYRYSGAPARFRSMHEYDARMAYVGLMSELPIGEPEVLTGRAARDHFQRQRYSSARYLVTWKAPSEWARPGILPAHSPGSDREWWWPLAVDEPSWCSAAEVFVAEQHGWYVGFHGAVVWPAKGSPLDVWRDRLLRVSDWCNAGPEPLRPLYRAAIRGLLLHTLGSFHGAPHVTTRTGTADDIDAEATSVRALPDGRWTWRVSEPAKWPEMCHPEWSATVWGRARARLLYGHRGTTGMLTVDPSTLVAARTDAVYTTTPTGWEAFDTGQPGKYRHRQYSWHALQARPATGPGLLRLREAAMPS
jgi:hypothetical protein